jgi:sugar transferase EpsL
VDIQDATVTQTIHPAVRSFCKRLLDAGAALLLLLVLSPVLLSTAALVAMLLGRPVLFRQQRPGRDAMPFTMIKFRTMRDATAPDGSVLPDAQRLTRLGRFLRATSLDELPELWNVLKGEMSLVGPRPLLMDYLRHYSPEQARRHAVRPGITGWAQVHGRNTAAWEDRLRLDVWYVDHWSFWLDVRILLRTAWTVVRREGISATGHATMPRFDEMGANVAGTGAAASPATKMPSSPPQPLPPVDR